MLLAEKKFEFHARVQKCHFGKIEKVQKALARIEKLFLFKVPMNLSKAWNAKLGAGIFLVV